MWNTCWLLPYAPPNGGKTDDLLHLKMPPAYVVTDRWSCQLHLAHISILRQHASYLYSCFRVDAAI